MRFSDRLTEMRVTRAGGHYLASRERRLWIGLAAAVGLGATGLMLAAWTDGLRRVIGVAVLVAVLAISTQVWRRLGHVREGRLGERLVSDLLSSLPDDYWLVNDVALGHGRGNVDHVLVGPCGVVVIETKRLRGHIRCYGDDWYVNRHRSKSISKQVNSGACAVRFFLTERHRDPRVSWVESVIVFTHPLCRLEIDRPRAIVVRYSELLEAVVELARKHQMVPEVAARFARQLVASQSTA
jgi:hypothetical protein